jgi:hypothetical protein
MRSTKVAFAPHRGKIREKWPIYRGKNQVPSSSGIAFASSNGEDSRRFQA